MLYNPEWSKPNPMSVEGIRAWLETKDPKGAYEYTASRRCLLAQYLEAQGCEDIGIGPFQYRFNGKEHYLPDNINVIAQGYQSDKSEWTYGQALERCKQYSK